MTPKQLIEILKRELKPIISDALEPILEEKLESIKKTQEVHSGKIDALIADMHVVRSLAETTVDVVKARYEKNKREIDEVKDHLGLTKQPYFGD